MTTTIPPAFSDTDDGWSQPADVELQLRAADPEDTDGDPDDDPAGGAPAPSYDADAPYGRFKNGKPKKAPARRSSRGPKRVPAPRRTAAKKSTTARPAKPAAPDYFRMSGDLVMEGVGVLGLVAKLAKSPALTLDAITLDLHAGNLADISAEFAEEEPRWAQLLERITSVSRWQKPLTVGIAIVVQGCVNHGMLPPGLMGSKEPNDLLKIAEQRAKAAAEAEAAEDRPSTWERAAA